MPRFVILRHDSPGGVHFDFMLEADAALKTWSLPTEPQIGATIDCESLADHRKAYLDFEGPISGGRGSVTQWDRGAYVIVRQTETEWVVKLAGERLEGVVTLCRDAAHPNRWRFSFAQG